MKKQKFSNNNYEGRGYLTKKVNAFTLIELLAIIVILAIIAVITVPIILGIVDDAKEKTAKDSAYGYKDAVNKYYAQELINNQNLKLNDTYTVTNGTLSGGDFGDSNITSLPIQVSGTVPTSGTLTYSNNKLTGGCLVIGDYAVTFGTNGEVSQTVKGDCSGSSSNEQGSGSQTVEPLDIGDTVNYTTTLNGQTLNNWKVFYIDGDYTYLIYGDYLPNAAISNTMRTTYDIETDDMYGIYVSEYDNSAEKLISAMATKSNWDSLLTGSINGHAVSESRTANVWAMGAPTVDLWVNSWNATYPSDTLYTRYVDTEDIEDENFNSTGYAIGDSENPTSTYIDLSSKTGSNDELYFQYKENAWAYWLASYSAEGNENVVIAASLGQIGYDAYYDYSCMYGLRPIICLPSSVVNQ